MLANQNGVERVQVKVDAGLKALSAEGEKAAKIIGDELTKLLGLQAEWIEKKRREQLITQGWTPPAEKAKPAPTEQPEPEMIGIIGYRKLSPVEITLINQVKQEGERIGQLVDRLYETRGLDQGWIAEGARDLRKGLMSLTRAIARPEGF